MREFVARLLGWWPVAIPALLAAMLHAKGFSGFWLGDDLPNLHRTHAWAQAGSLWIDTARQFISPITGGGSFIRPMMIATLSLNYELSGLDYAGWFALNFAVHVANVALVACVVLLLARRLACDGRAAAMAAALLFGLSPVIAEGVYWVSARSDGWVTLLSLASVALWLREGTRHSAWIFPILLAIALGFKESAAVLPFQVALVALAWPGSRPRGMGASIVAGLVIVALYFAYRAALFGAPFATYVADPAHDARWWGRGVEAVLSLGPWAVANAGSYPGHAAAHGALLVASLGLGLAACRGPRLRLAAAFLCAGGGQLAATLVNLGRLAPSGEGGRLLYEPMAWIAIGIGLLAARPIGEPRRAAGGAALAALFLCAAVGAVQLHATIRHVAAVQEHSRELVAAVGQWAAARKELTMLVVPEQQGAIVSLRNAQASLVMPPLQSRGIIHLVLPTLPREIAVRYDQFAGGLATRLAKIVPKDVDAATLRALEAPDVALWPEAACWSPGERRIMALGRADPAARDAWIRKTRAAALACLPDDPALREP
jgi:hypothetical protein